MGTPEFAVPSLEILLQNKYNIKAVITASDKPKGRGQRIYYSPVKQFALEHGIAVLQPSNLKSQEFVEQLQKYHAHLQVVVAFRMLPRVVWSMPKYGTFNLHASMLPAYRGAAPINWAIINGERTTGVTTFFIEEAIDAGQIIYQKSEAITEQDTAGTLHDRLMHVGAELVLQTVKDIESNNCTRLPQAPTVTDLNKLAPKLSKDDCEINWTRSAIEVVNFIRGLSPYPSAWTVFNDKIYKILAACVADNSLISLAPGKFYLNGKCGLYVGVNDGIIEIKVLQAEGKRALDIKTFLRGNKV